MAKLGIGLIGYNLSVFAYDVKSSSPREQRYWGEKPSLLNSTVVFLTSDALDGFLPNAQVQLSLAANFSTWQPYAKDSVSLNGLALYYTMFDKKVEIKTGYVANSMEFVGSFVGGNLASPFGVSAGIPYELGMSLTGQPAPTIRAKMNWTSRLYNQVAVQRSLSPTAANVFDSVSRNPSGTRFSVSGWGTLILNEVGYKKPPGPSDHSLWVRGGALFNNSKYYNYATTGHSRNQAFYALADAQVQRGDNTVSTSQGIYLGASAMTAPAKLNIFSRNYEVRAYAIGLSDSRPSDMLSLVLSYNQISGHVRAIANTQSLQSGRKAHSKTRTITASYSSRLAPGVWATVGVARTDNPTIYYSSVDGPALNILSSLYLVF